MDISLITVFAPLFFGLLIFYWFVRTKKRYGQRASRIVVVIAAYHLSFYILHLNLDIFQNADSVNYFIYGKNGDAIFRPGAGFIRSIVVFLDTLSFGDLSYADASFVFMIIGYGGFCFLLSALLNVWPNHLKHFWFIYFLPSTHLWNATIGKDAVAFLGLTAFIYAICKQRISHALLFSSIALVFMSRPHMAIILASSFLLANMLESNNKPIAKILISGCVAISLALILPYAFSYVGLTNEEGLANYIETRQSYNQLGGGAIELDNMSPIAAVFSYLFRPLYIDANGLFSFIASIENTILLIIFLRILASEKLRAVKKWIKAPFFSCSIIYTLTAIPILALTTANLGIAIRQKAMIVPFVLLILIQLEQYYKPRKAAAQLVNGR